MSRAGDTAAFQEVFPSERGLPGLPISSWIATLLVAQLGPSKAYPEAFFVRNAVAPSVRTTTNIANNRGVLVLSKWEPLDGKTRRAWLIISI